MAGRVRAAEGAVVAQDALPGRALTRPLRGMGLSALAVSPMMFAFQIPNPFCALFNIVHQWLGGIIILSIVVRLAGGHPGTSSPAFTQIATLIQDAIFVGAAVLFATRTSRPRPWHFGPGHVRAGSDPSDESSNAGVGNDRQ